MRIGIAFVALLCGLVLFTGLGAVGALDRREATDLRVAVELIENREALTPILGFEPLFTKPILSFAPEVAVRLWTDRPELPSRLWRAALALVLVVLTGSIGARHLGARAGLFSAGVLATAMALPIAARTDGTQLIASVLAWAGVAQLADALFGREGGRDARLAIGYGALAAAFVVAGPLPALWPLAGMALYLWLARQPGAWRRLRPLPGLALIAGLALPWYGAMFERHGLEFLANAPFMPYAGEPRLHWFLGPFLAASLVLIGFFPWTAFLPGAFLHAAAWWPRRRRDATGASAPPVMPHARELEHERTSHLFIACAGAALIPAMAYPHAPLTSSLPALPALALLCGRLLDHLVEDPERVAGALGRGLLMLALTGSVGAVSVALVAGRVGEAGPALRLVATLLFVTSWLPFLAGFTGRRLLAALLVTLPVAIVTPVTALRALPALEGWFNARAAASAMNRAAPPLAPLVLESDPPPSLRLYSERNLVWDDSLSAALRSYVAPDGFAYVAFRPFHRTAVEKAAPGPLETIAATPSLVVARVRPEER